MEDGGGIVNNVARAIAVALDWSTSSDAREAAYSYLESVKSGDVRILASTSFALVKKDWSSEIRLHAFKMLQHLVRLRWDELSLSEKQNFASMSIELISEMANPCEEWALKSQTAALAAEIVRREGVNLWTNLLPSLVSLSNQGPVQAEIVSMVLRWLPEDILVHNEDLEGDRRRLLLRGLTQSLPEIFSLLYNLLGRHYTAAFAEVDRQQIDVAKQHAASVSATLHAISAYAEWAPLPDLTKSGIVYGCGSLLSSHDFRLHACEFFKLISLRKRPTDGVAEFDSAMREIFNTLVKVSRDFLQKTRSGVIIDESEYEFGECICESMVSLGSSNWQSVSGDATIISSYLEQMLEFFRHDKLALHSQSLHFWLALTRDLLLKSKIAVHADNSVGNISTGSGHADIEKKKMLALLNDDFCCVILDICFRHMLKKEKAHPQSAALVGTLELWSDDFEGKGDFGQYRSRLLELIRFVASDKPLVAAYKVSEIIQTIIENLLQSPIPAQELAVWESMQLPLENVVSTVFDGNDFSRMHSDFQHELHRVFGGLLQKLLSLKWTEPLLVEVLGHYLVALGPFLNYYPNAVSSVINKLFELLNSMPFAVKDPSTSTSRHARLQICTSFIRIAKAADKSLLPHTKDIADTMACLQKEGRLLQGEYNLLAEAFLIMASAAGLQQQHEVLVWLLEPLSVQWTQPEWQDAYLSEPSGLVRLCEDASFMWSVFHTVTLFEKALKRSGYRKGNTNLIFQNNPVPNSIALHPMGSHISWMLPPLLKLLRVVHSLWSPSISQQLPVEIKGAMIISDHEGSSLVGDGSFKAARGAISFTDATQFDIPTEGSSEPMETGIRNWLKGIRESGYMVLGLSATIEDCLFKFIDPNSIALALMENIQTMEFRHLRQLVHSTLVPIVKHCPSDMWERWVEKLLHPLLIHSQLVLGISWTSLLQEGRAKVPDLHGIQAGSDLKVEVIEEKLLRDLTREICSLLSVLASPGLNPGLPSLEQSGHFSRLEVSSLRNLDTFTTSAMVGFLLNHKSLAVPALQISLEALRWTDSESVGKVTTFCRSIILLSIFADNGELVEYVCQNLFHAIIQGLALESNAFGGADLVGLCREIFVYLSDRHPAPRQILLSLPCIKPQDLLAFEEALTKTASPKEQKQHMRSFLLLGTGNNLKALVAQKSANAITNVSLKSRNPTAPASETTAGEGELIGLAALT